MKHKTSCSLVTLAMLLLASAQASDFVSPQLKEKGILIRHVVMLPPIVGEVKKGVKGKEGMGKEAEEASAEMASGVSTALTSRGISVENPFNEEALKDNEELRTAMADVQKRFDE